MRKIILFILLSFFMFISAKTYAHADYFQDVYNLIHSDKSDDPSFPNARLDGGGYLEANQYFCPVCPPDRAILKYQKAGNGGEANLLGCYDPSGNRMSVNLGDYSPIAIDCTTTDHKICGVTPQGVTKGCCKDSSLNDCKKRFGDSQPPPTGGSCARCPEGTFWTDRGTGEACYYIDTKSHNRAENVGISDNDDPCPSEKPYCDETYKTGCYTEEGLANLQDNPPQEDPTMTNAPLSRPCSDADNSATKGCIRIKTAFGNISTDSAGFTKWVLGFVLSISGGIVVIIIIISGYRLMTSSGDPEKVKNARDQLTAAVVGLLFIIFSLVILELITKDVLGLPGFGS